MKPQPDSSNDHASLIVKDVELKSSQGENERGAKYYQAVIDDAHKWVIEMWTSITWNSVANVLLSSCKAYFDNHNFSLSDCISTELNNFSQEVHQFFQ